MMRASFAMVLMGTIGIVFGQKLGEIVVQADSLGYGRIPLQVEMPATFPHMGPLRLMEKNGASTPIPAQWDSLGGAAIWFILPDSISPHSLRVFDLEPGEVPATPFSFVEKHPYLELQWNRQSVLRYNFGLVPAPAGVNPVFARHGAYIHPLFSPVGDTLTDDFPSDHLHHRGIFMPWRMGEFEGHRVDFWLMDAKQGVIRFRDFGPKSAGPVFAGFLARHDHVDPTQNPPSGKMVLSEEWKVQMFAVGGSGENGSWVFDITSIQQCAGASPLKLSPWEYQGMTFRGAAAWKGKEQFLTPSGSITRPTREKWQVMSGPHGNRFSSVELMSHPGNFRHPEPTTTWPGISFIGYTPPAIGEWVLEPGKKYVFRYRYVIAMGRMTKPKAEQSWHDFATPPKTSFQTVSGLSRGLPPGISPYGKRLPIRTTRQGPAVYWPHGGMSAWFRLLDGRNQVGITPTQQ